MFVNIYRICLGMAEAEFQRLLKDVQIDWKCPKCVAHINMIKAESLMIKSDLWKTVISIFNQSQIQSKKCKMVIYYLRHYFKHVYLILINVVVTVVNYKNVIHLLFTILSKILKFIINRFTNASLQHSSYFNLNF